MGIDFDQWQVAAGHLLTAPAKIVQICNIFAPTVGAGLTETLADANLKLDRISIMTAPAQPFPLPRTLPSPLAAVHQYWKSLIRAENTMPFADDVNLSQLPAPAGGLLLVDVFANPQRFRFNYLGEELVRRLSANLTGEFADEVELRSPFDFFIAQASTTVEARAPTVYSSARADRHTPRAAGYSRIMLPTWGDGRIELLLGAIA